MNGEITAFPLSWPVMRPRTPQRKVAGFGQAADTSWGGRRLVPLTVAKACERLSLELSRLPGSKHWIISTNLPVTRDNWPRSNQGEPKDPGVAVYFKWRGRDYCLACDRWTRVADNIAAIAAELEASRGRERWGVVTLEEAFAGFAALPAKAAWWEVLGLATLPVDLATLKARYRELARQHHPDVGGSHERMAELSEAYEEGLSSLG